jgi:hypothetical protein
MSTPPHCDDDAEGWKTERIEHAKNQLETGDDPGDALTHLGEIDFLSGHNNADDYYNNNVRRIYNSGCEISRSNNSDEIAPNLSDSPAPLRRSSARS